MQIVLSIWFSLVLFISLGRLASGRTSERERATTLSELMQLSQMSRTGADFPTMLALEPMKKSPYIMYWRPQKVGSSTLLSLLMSYAYRYNLLPRRKDASNAFCRMIAKCALEEHRALLTAPQRKYLERFAARKQSVRSKEREVTRNEKLAAAVPFTISLTHEICNLNRTIVNTNLQCAFDQGQKTAINTSQVLAYKPKILEIFQVREPLSRAVSVYYFWGELYKLVKEKKKRLRIGRNNKNSKGDFKVIEGEQEPTIERHFREVSAIKQGVKSKDVLETLENVISAAANAVVNAVEPNDVSRSQQEQEQDALKQNRRRRNRRHKDVKGLQQRRQLRDILILGEASDSPVEGSFFTYHGDEHTPPPVDLALSYVNSFPYNAGMPGPSYTWSAFANGVRDAVDRISNDNDKLMTIVLERLDESLIVMRHHLQWSLADVVVLKQRKALSAHPKAKDWPEVAVEQLRKKLVADGEYQVYNASLRALDARLEELRVKHHVDVDKELQQLAVLRQRASEWCLNNDTRLIYYRDMLSRVPLPAHASENKLRDVEQKYVDGKHLFSFNRELLCSFDVCAACESHAMLKAVQIGLARDIESAPGLFELPSPAKTGDINFAHCPIL